MSKEVKERYVCMICRQAKDMENLRKTKVAFMDPPDIITFICTDCITEGEKAWQGYSISGEVVDE